MTTTIKNLFTLLFVLIITGNSVQAQMASVFTGNNDVGNVGKRGSTQYNSGTQEYTLTGSGTNVWGGHDAFQYAWKKVKGDFILQTRGKLQGTGTDPHRKLGWMVRTSLDSTAAMASAAVHGDGLASLQYRPTAGADVQEAKFTTAAPDVIQLERKGNTYIMSVARFGEPYVTQTVDSIALGDEVYVGLFVCAHNNTVTEKAVFDNVRIVKPTPEGFVPYRQYLGSHMETLDVHTGKRTIVYTDTVSLQAPNYTKDGGSLIYNTSKGLMYRFDLRTKAPSPINTDFVKANNNDHVLSFDGKMLGLSSSSAVPNQGSIVYTVPVEGGVPKQITPVGPSYLHGWSPDGKYLVYTGQRNKDFDIYRIPATGGEEVRLTTAPGLDDGSEYSPDGQYIYFNSVRSGTMQLWRMKADGSDQEQVTNDEYNNWFPHISPDGKWIAFLSFMKDVDPGDHPFYKRVYLRLMPVSGGTPKVIAYVYGGQGSINTPSWSPDSKKIAFISNSDIKNQ